MQFLKQHAYMYIIKASEKNLALTLFFIEYLLILILKIVNIELVLSNHCHLDQLSAHLLNSIWQMVAIFSSFHRVRTSKCASSQIIKIKYKQHIFPGNGSRKQELKHGFCD